MKSTLVWAIGDAGHEDSDFVSVSDDRMQSGLQDTGQLNFLPARYLHGGD